MRFPPAPAGHKITLMTWDGSYRRGAVALVILAAAGCDTAMTRRGFESPDPHAKLTAVVQAGQQRDAKALPHLVNQLDSDDPAVRLCSIIAMQRITGTRMGYSPYAPAHERREAVQRWVQAVQSGRFDESNKRVSR